MDILGPLVLSIHADFSLLTNFSKVGRYSDASIEDFNKRITIKEAAELNLFNQSVFLI